MDIEGHTYNTSSEAFLNKLCKYFANVGATKDAKSLNNWKRLFHQKFRLLKFENRGLRNRKHPLTVPLL